MIKAELFTWSIGDWLFRNFKCAECGAFHDREEWHYQDGDFALTITVDMCPRARTK